MPPPPSLAFSGSAVLPSNWLCSPLGAIVSTSIDPHTERHSHPSSVALVSSASSSVPTAAAKSTLPTARKTRRRASSNVGSNRLPPPLQQAATVDHVVDTFVPVIDTLPTVKHNASATRRNIHTVATSKNRQTAAPAPKVTAAAANATVDAVKVSKTSTATATTTTSPSTLPTGLASTAGAAPVAPSANSTISPSTTTPTRKTTPRKKRASQKNKPTSKTPPAAPVVENHGSVPLTPAVPAVTPEETRYLNEQLEKRKQEKQALVQSRQTRAAKKKRATPKRKDVVSNNKAIMFTAAPSTVEQPQTQLEKSLPTSSKSSAVSTSKSSRKRIRSGRPYAGSSSSSGSVQDSFRKYMVEISRNNLLGQAEVVSLAHQIREGMAVERLQNDMQRRLGRRPSVLELSESLGVSLTDTQRRIMTGMAAKNTLVSANLRLVTSVANKLIKSKSGSMAQGLTIDDMIQEGSVGLIRAAEKFDATRGYKFSTYATWWIRAYVMRSITNQGRCIKVPSSIVDEYARIRRMFQTLRESGIEKPTEEQVAHKLGITPGKLRMVVNVVTQVPASLDVPIDIPSASSDRSRSLLDIVQGNDHVEEKMVRDMQHNELDLAMRKYLLPVERAVIRLRFGLEDGQPRSFREIGELLKLSKERIRQLMFRSLPKLKTPEIQRMLQQAAMD